MLSVRERWLMKIQVLRNFSFGGMGRNEGPPKRHYNQLNALKWPRIPFLVQPACLSPDMEIQMLQIHLAQIAYLHLPISSVWKA